MNLTTKNYDWKKNNIKLPKFSKDNLCFVDLSMNDSYRIYNKKYEELEIKNNLVNLKDISLNNFTHNNTNKEEKIYSKISIPKSAFANNLKVLNQKKDVQSSDKDSLFIIKNKNSKNISLLKVQGIKNFLLINKSQYSN